MQTIADIKEMQASAEEARRGGKRIAVVPTMGSLHAGHVSLMKLARTKCDVLVTTLFVNPLQFGPSEDFARYPRDLKHDQKIASEAGTDILFSPEADEVYPGDFKTSVEVKDVSTILEGKFRPGHFVGVLTVVLKLFNITKPHLAVFGQKDAQQAFLIRKMAGDLNLDLEIDVAPIVREEDGLALSSRNAYLSADERKRATSLYRALRSARERLDAGERSVEVLRAGMVSILAAAQPNEVDYIAFVEPERFKEVNVVQPPNILVALAVRFGSTRLIDNIIVSLR